MRNFQQNYLADYFHDLLSPPAIHKVASRTKKELLNPKNSNSGPTLCASKLANKINIMRFKHMHFYSQHAYFSKLFDTVN